MEWRVKKGVGEGGARRGMEEGAAGKGEARFWGKTRNGFGVATVLGQLYLHGM